LQVYNILDTSIAARRRQARWATESKRMRKQRRERPAADEGSHLRCTNETSRLPRYIKRRGRERLCDSARQWSQDARSGTCPHSFQGNEGVRTRVDAPAGTPRF